MFITFLSDFGLQDDFVGTCHGVMKRIAPEAEIIDITHGIEPQQVLQGALVLGNTLPYMPAAIVPLRRIAALFIEIAMIPPAKRSPHDEVGPRFLTSIVSNDSLAGHAIVALFHNSGRLRPKCNSLRNDEIFKHFQGHTN